MQIKNISGEVKQLHTHEFQDQEILDIDSSWYIDDVISSISAGDFIILKDNTEVVGVTQQVNVLKGDFKNVVPFTEPFASKVLFNGKKLFIRNHGQSTFLDSGVNMVDFIIPYAHCKINEMEIINGEIGDKVNFKVLDSSAGTYTTVPYYQLNQFAFDLNIPKDYYKRKCSYDADLYGGMIIRIEYNSATAKTVYFNYVLHEVKD